MNNFFYVYLFFQDLRFQQHQYEHQIRLQRNTQQSEYQDRNQLETHSNPTEFSVYEDFQKQPVARNNLNHCLNNSNTSKPRSLLYELKQYENFTNNAVENSSNNLKNSNSNSYNYTNNILNYNNNYYKINNIGNYNNLLKNQSSQPLYTQNLDTQKGTNH